MFRWQLMSSVYLTILQIAGIVFLGRFLGYQEMGIYAIFQLIFRFATALFEPGMFVSVIQRKFHSKTILNNLYKWQMSIAAVGFIMIFIFFITEDLYYRENLIFVITALFLFLWIAWGARYTAILTHHLKQRQISMALIAGATLEFLFMLCFIWHFDPMWVFPISFLFRFLIYYGACYILTLKNNFELHPILDGVEEKAHIRFSMYQIVNQGLSFIQGNFDTALILFAFGLQVLGPYNFASELSYLLFSKLNPVFNKAVFPVLAKHQDDPSVRQEIMSESLLSHALVCLGLYLLFYFHLPEIIGLLFKDELGQILHFSKFICIMAMIRSVTNLVFSQLLALGASRKLLQWNVTVLLLNYAFIFIIYLTKSHVDTFLTINIFVSLGVFMFTLMHMFKYYSDVKKGMHQLLYFVFYLCVSGIILYGIQFTGFGLWISLTASGMAVISLDYLFYRQKFLNLIRFRIL